MTAREFGRALWAEWIKVRSTRPTVWTPAAIVVLLPALAAFVGATGSLQPDDTVLGGSLTGAVLGQIVAAVFGVLVVSGEHGTGLIRSTLQAVPRREAVLAAKAVVAAVPAFVLTLLGSTAAYLVGDALLAGKGYAQGTPVPALIGVALCGAAAALLGLAFGVLLRHSAGAICAVIGVILLPSLLGPLFGDLRRWVAGASPAALQKLAQTSDATPEAVGTLGAWPSLWLVCGYSMALLVCAGLALRHRDA